ncbi:MAG: hypothetical protein IJ300_11335 [Clostridia bacterium]|nr:hypothetical protein [Clostridia bacterium]
MENKLYIVGSKVGSGYPEGRYVCTKLEGKVHNHFFVKLVLDYPSVRAVANDEAWSNAEVYHYGKMFSFLRSKMILPPEEYTKPIVGIEETDYELSLISAIEKAIDEYREKGDEEAVERLQNRLAEAVTAVGLKAAV